MKGAVVYYSRWGNCKQVAEAIVKGLSEKGQEVALLDAKTQELPANLDFIVAGSPTRGGQMSGPMKRFIEREIDHEWTGKPFAAFGTGHLKRIEAGDPRGALAVYQALLDAGLAPLAPPLQAVVKKMRGPLVDGSLDTAYRFGLALGDGWQAERDRTRDLQTTSRPPIAPRHASIS